MSDEPADETAESIGRARALLEARLAELELERKRVRAALDHLRPNGTEQPKAPRRRGRRKRARRGQRQEEFLALLRAKPGASIAEIAREMGVKPQQLYAVARKLTESGAVTKRDGAYVAVDGESPAPAADN
jgi:DNA invertase Pin-like site-specific DNA recombinase